LITNWLSFSTSSFCVSSSFSIVSCSFESIISSSDFANLSSKDNVRNSLKIPFNSSSTELIVNTSSSESDFSELESESVLESANIYSHSHSSSFSNTLNNITKLEP